MRILVTGSCGYVGSVLVPKLEAAGYEVAGIDLKWFYQDESTVTGDVRNLLSATAPDVPGKPDCIIHLAAISNDPSTSYYTRRSWETSVLATQQLAQMAVKTGCRFIYASSVSVYGADRGMVTEDMDLHPLSDYNRTKICAERVLLSYPDLRPQIIRPATICGLSPRMRLDLTVNLFTIQALTKGVITVHGGTQWRPNIHIDDMTDLYVWMVEHPEVHGVFNAGFENHSLLEIADAVASQTGATVTVTPQKDARSYRVNSQKLIKAGFRPKKNIYAAIFEMRDAYQQGLLEDKPEYYNLGWMARQKIKDE